MSAEWQGVKSAGNEGTQTRQRSTFRSSRSRCDNMCIVPADPCLDSRRARGGSRSVRLCAVGYQNVLHI